MLGRGIAGVLWVAVGRIALSLRRGTICIAARRVSRDTNWPAIFSGILSAARIFNVRKQIDVLLFIGAVLVAAAPRAAQAATNYTFTTIDVPGATDTLASGTNNVGQIVGSFFDGFLPTHGFLYSGGSFITIDVPGASYTFASGINDAGQIVGSYRNSTGYHGFLYSGGRFTTIDVPGASYTYASGVNNAGQIVGGFDDAAGSHGFLYNSGSFTTINVPGVTFNTGADGINDTGQIVGSFQDNANPHGFLRTHGFLYSSGSFTTINVPGAANTYAIGVNGVGQIVGYSEDSAADTHSFFYNSGRFTIIDVPGAAFTQAFGINDAGEIVGGYYGGHGFLATPSALQPEILFNGYDSTNTLRQYLNVTFKPAVVGQNIQRAVVGQEISLSAALPSAVTVKSQEWHIDGNPIGGYTPTKESFQTGRKLPLVTSNASITFYWDVPTMIASGPHTVTYNYTLTSGKTGKIEAKYNVSSAPTPVVHFKEKTAGVSCSAYPYCDIQYITKNGQTFLAMGFGNATMGSLNLGMVISTSTNPSPGTFNWVQLVLGDEKSWIDTEGHKHNCSFSPGLDLTYPYDSGLSTDDSPATGLFPDYASVGRGFLAQMFLMWQSNIRNAIPVPLGSLKWKFIESSRVDNHAPHGWATPTVTAYPGTFVKNLLTYPVWDALAKSTFSCH